MAHRVSIRQESPDSVSRRLRLWLSRAVGTRLQKSQRTYFVTLNGHRYKRLVEPDTNVAESIEAALLAFGATDRLPAFVTRYEHEVWVEFIEGRVPREADEALALAAAGFFAVLYTRGAREVATSDTRFPAALARNLRFLHRMDVLDDAAYAELSRAAQALAPESVWVGFEYTDPIPKNFVVAADDGRLCAVDVESLASDELLGVGPAKALSRWLEPHREVFLAALAQPGVPDLRPALPFAELYFLAHWMQRAFMERKWHFVDSARFARFRDGASAR